jgi:16S rRNA (guanine(527)-N(7))-methyltransferase RsmG
MIPSPLEFLTEIQAKKLDLTPEQAKQAAKFAHILHRENELQNLTRILGVSEFVEGHLIDVMELFKVPTLGERVLDIGSGSGVPGLLAASVDSSKTRQWFLSDSETSKGEYLSRGAEELGLERVATFSRRAEEVLDFVRPDTVIARAVGTVEKIAGWISNCSTWNNLVLFKSRGWEEEWKEAQLSRFGKKLTVTHTHEYSVGDKYRVLVSLKRK